MSKRIDYSIIGKTFNLLTVVEYSHTDDKGCSYWKCICTCGKHVTAKRDRLTCNRKKSCGGSNHSKAHHDKITGKKHELYVKWVSIKTRCSGTRESDRKYYSSKGIIVCDEWKDDYETFKDWSIANGWQLGFHIHRKDEDKNYCPANCEYIDAGKHSALHQKVHRTVNKKTGYYNVYYKKREGRYVAVLLVNKVIYQSQYYKTAKDAAIAYNHIVTSNGFDRPLNPVD